MRAKHFLFVAETSQLMARTPGHMAVPRHQPCKFVKLRNCGPARPEYYFATARNIFLSHTKIFPATKIQFAGLKQDYRVADPCKHTH